MKSKRKKRRKSQRRERDAAAILSQRVQQRFPDQKVVAREARDGVKMSEVLREFIAPYREFANTEEAFRKLVVTAIVAWNAALFSAQERKIYIEKVLQVLPEEVRADGRTIVSELVERKQRHFSEYKRMIIDYEVTDTGKGYHLVVISTDDELTEE